MVMNMGEPQLSHLLLRDVNDGKRGPRKQGIVIPEELLSWPLTSTCIVTDRT